MEIKLFSKKEPSPSSEQKMKEARDKAREEALGTLSSSTVVESTLRIYWETISLSEADQQKAIGESESPNRLYWYVVRDLANYYFNGQQDIVIDENAKPNQETVYDPDQHWNVDGHAKSGDKVYYAEPRYLFRWVEPDSGGTVHLEQLRRTKVSITPTESEFFPTR